MLDAIHDLPNADTFAKTDLIDKGWSSDKKYCVTTVYGEKRLLRISDIAEYENKKHEFELMKRFSLTGIKMSQPLDFGICNNGKLVYQLLTWCEGEEAKTLLPSLSQQAQYEFGCKAGQMLRTMQAVESHPPSADWATAYGGKVKKYLEDYQSCGETLLGAELLFPFLNKHMSCLQRRPMSLLHADFQSDNMVISPQNELYVIDFQGSGLVDPYYALTGAMVTAEVSPSFAIGQLHSYFDGDVPADFWTLNAFYLAAESIHAFTVAVTLGKEEVAYSNELMRTMLAWFDNLNNLVPGWFTAKDCLTQNDRFLSA
ncbi:aminoglycoside phosphotransferase family protein [Pasteurella testudinis]|uniref:aminoglycoside phosphotransferase family protein n=1 Tax=Pasteurella testudinis TaxID=761 RepID=UPI0040595419